MVQQIKGKHSQQKKKATMGIESKSPSRHFKYVTK